MGNGIFKVSNLKKTYYYLKKNGLKNAYYAALERIMREKNEDYRYEMLMPDQKTLKQQKEIGKTYPYTFSILVPTYETKEEYLREMADSVLQQTYGKFKLVIADASRSEAVRNVMDTYSDKRIQYIRLTENNGISENTNAALKMAEGDYIALLDHDDVLTPDALFEMAKAIKEKEKNGNMVWMLYSDEDKGNGDLTQFYEPHFKPDLNMDLLMSNNYICHFLVMKREVLQELKLRKEYDGAQDYDLVLRAVEKLIYEKKTGREAIVHIPKVLYHWRCHTASTAENPESKRYAYEAGKHALEDLMRRRGWKGSVSHTLHLGFYRIDYEKDIFSQRKEVGVIGGKLFDRRERIIGGIYDHRGKCPYLGLGKNFSGYMHRAVLAQEAYAVDIRCMRVRKELRTVFEEFFGVPYCETKKNGKYMFDYKKLSKRIPDGKEGEKEWIRCSMEFAKKVRRAGYILVWMPDYGNRIDGRNGE